MCAWKYRVTIKHLLTPDEEHHEVQRDMSAVADVLDRELCFAGFNTSAFRSIPEGDDFFTPSEYANRLLDRMYNYANEHRIWIE
jgi:hypothetical protein